MAHLLNMQKKQERVISSFQTIATMSTSYNKQFIEVEEKLSIVLPDCYKATLKNYPFAPSFIMLFISGFLAVLVSFEESYRVYTETRLSKDKHDI